MIALGVVIMIGSAIGISTRIGIMADIAVRDFWFIAHFDDYHEIDSLANASKPFLMSHELGTFDVKGFPYKRYYGVFWNGSIPSTDAINMLLGEFGVDPTENDISYPDEESRKSSIQ